ncbi:mechanosensitive ion channel family protein [Arenimonas caeni]|jgi:small-conductance mechanosensitive channel|uniref:Small-conductance mechanosensitive channel n=1 Tax=Arenimonas caeni TaxID=2058085 RepID=A0A2P6MB71_9GAMM|nr:mechanosensitive ion channel domain-containing protein [Arenimonas caeni]MDY0022009.1 mechanosensitive ion channel [Arenimonas caeni]PRH83238.1 mechanosensitive ion channel protein MscS [Arenimonas caeni]
MTQPATPAPSPAATAAEEVASPLQGLENSLIEMLGTSPWLVRVALAVVVGLVGWWAVKLLTRGLDRVMQRAGMDQILRDFLRNFARVLGLVVVLVAVLDAVGVPTTSLLAVLGAAGLAIGLALKDSLSNIASGVMLIVLRPFRAGDAVEIAGKEGVVERVRIFQTVLRAYQNHDIILPNSQITTQPIVNFTSRPQRRIDLAVGIGYGEEIRKAREVLLGIARGHDKVLATPEPEVLVAGLGESSVDLVLRAWVGTPDFVATRSDLTEAVHRSFSEQGISIPFPQRDLHIYHHGGDGRALPIDQVVTLAEGDGKPRT